MFFPLPEYLREGLLLDYECRLFDQVDQYASQNSGIFPQILVNNCGNGGTLEHVTQRGGEVSLFGDIQTATGHSPG